MSPLAQWVWSLLGVCLFIIGAAFFLGAVIAQ
jgi:hypothetical protein